MPTIKELSDTLGVSSQTIRRFVKAEFDIQSEPRKAIILDANQASIVANHFKTDNNISISPVATNDVDLLQEVATLKERVAGLERENQLLKERLEIADKALEREQMQARGFWSRLGQKLLGEGKSKE